MSITFGRVLLLFVGFLLLTGCSNTSSGVQRNSFTFPSNTELTSGGNNAHLIYGGSEYDVQLLLVTGAVDASKIFDIQKQKVLTQLDGVVRLSEGQITNPCGGISMYGERKVGENVFLGSVIGEEGSMYGIFANNVAKSDYQKFLGLIKCN